MTSIEKDIAQYRTEHLFLLIGGNPLPNYVAAKLLAKPKDGNYRSRIHFVRSSQTLKEAKRLKYVLGKENFIFDNADANDIIVDPSKQSSIEEKVEARIAALIEAGTSSIGLNYTGGTKAMSVHSYRIIKEICEAKSIKPVFSYLDPREVKMRIDGSNEDFPLDDPRAPYFKDIDILPRHLLSLHSLETKSPPQEKARFLDSNLVDAIFEELTINSENWENFRAKIQEKLKASENEAKREPRNKRKAHVEACLRRKRCAIADLPRLKTSLEKEGLVENGDLVLAKIPSEKEAKDFCDYLVAKWLEDYVLERMLELKDECNLSDCASNVVIKHPDNSKLDYFEVDDIALRGYQLFAVTCAYSFEDNKSYYKQKIFEGLLRAQQLGGSEVRVALVCMANAETAARLEQELFDPHVKVWGKEEVESKARMKEILHDWFTLKG